MIGDYQRGSMAKRLRHKRINFEVSDEAWDDIHQNVKDLNITVRAYIWRLILPDILMRKRLRKEGEGK